MPNNIKPSEVSEVLLQQLKSLDTKIQFEEVGVVAWFFKIYLFFCFFKIEFLCVIQAILELTL